VAGPGRGQRVALDPHHPLEGRVGVQDLARGRAGDPHPERELSQDPVARLLAVIASVLAAQSFVLRPLLVARVLRIIAGESVPPSQVHNLYLALEAVLLVLILAVGIFSIRHLESDQS